MQTWGPSLDRGDSSVLWSEVATKSKVSHLWTATWLQISCWLAHFSGHDRKNTAGIVILPDQASGMQSAELEAQANKDVGDFWENC